MPATIRIKVRKDLGRVYHNFLKREARLIETLDKREKDGKNFNRENNWQETNSIGRVWSF